MYLCSDLKNVNANYRNSFLFNKVDLLNDKNMKSNISELKKSIDKKKSFLSSCRGEAPRGTLVDKSIDIAITLNQNFMEESKSEGRTNSREMNSTIEQLEQNSISNEKKLDELSVNVDKKMTDSEINKSASKKASISPKKHKKSYSYGGMMLYGNSVHDSPVKKQRNKEFNKIFDKHLNCILEIKTDRKSTNKQPRIKIEEERLQFAEKSRVNHQIVQMRDKIHFMKGIVDYCFPKILIGKVQSVQDDLIKLKKQNLVRNPTSLLQDIYSNSNNNIILPKIPIMLTPRTRSPSNSRLINSINNSKRNVKVMSPLHIRSISSFD